MALEQTAAPSEAVQNYLKTIYELTAGAPDQTLRATTNDIAERLAIKPASVTGMLQKLAAEGWVDYRKHQGASLTADGRTAALRVIRHHRLIETFLHDMLGYGWDEVHDEAEKLEHVISPAVSQRMADVLGNPRRDPHGDQIPDRHLHLRPSVGVLLTTLRPGEQATVLRVNDHDPHLLRRLAALGVVPGTPVVLDGLTADGALLLRAQGETVVTIDPGVAAHIFVEQEGE